MNIIHRLGLCAAASLCAFSAFAVDVGVSVSVSQPGFFGRIDIGTPPPPAALIFPQPVIIQPAPVAVRPMYLRVPPGHEKNWGKHCAKYNACGAPVYFIRDSYYQQHYVVQQPPRVVNGMPVMVVAEKGGRGGRGGDDDHPGQGRGKDKGDKGDKGGKGHGHGNGNGKGGKHD